MQSMLAERPLTLAAELVADVAVLPQPARRCRGVFFPSGPCPRDAVVLHFTDVTDDDRGAGYVYQEDLVHTPDGRTFYVEPCCATCSAGDLADDEDYGDIAGVVALPLPQRVLR